LPSAQQLPDACDHVVRIVGLADIPRTRRPTAGHGRGSADSSSLLIVEDDSAGATSGGACSGEIAGTSFSRHAAPLERVGLRRARLNADCDSTR
jgi:hypothetical protein